MLTQTEVMRRLRYEPASGEFVRLNSGRPCATSRWGGKPAGTVTHNGYLMIGLSGVAVQAHRLAWLYMTGALPAGDIDHINGDRTDNRWSNLREVSRQTNLQNQRAASRNNICGLLGVSPKRDKFQARIMVDRKTIRLGVFDTPAEAHAAYVAAKRRLHQGNTL